MSAQLIFDRVPLGALIRYADGSPRPPERHRKKLAAWENRNSSGRLIAKRAQAVVGSTTLPASITLHKGDFGSGGVIVPRVHQTFSVNSDLIRGPRKAPALDARSIATRRGGACTTAIRRAGPMRSRSTGRSAPACAASVERSFSIVRRRRWKTLISPRQPITASSISGPTSARVCAACSRGPAPRGLPKKAAPGSDATEVRHQRKGARPQRCARPSSSQ